MNNRLTEQEILDAANEAISKATNGIVANEIIILMGHPVVSVVPGVVNPDIEDSSMSEAILNNCSECKIQVWSTVVKNKIIELRSNSVLLCIPCMTELIKKNNLKVINHLTSLG